MRDLIEKAKSVALFLWDVIIPRFVTEDVAVQKLWPGPQDDLSCYEIVACMDDIGPEEVFDGICTVDSFQAFGIGFAYRIGNFRTWPGSLLDECYDRR